MLGVAQRVNALGSNLPSMLPMFEEERRPCG